MVTATRVKTQEGLLNPTAPGDPPPPAPQLGSGLSLEGGEGRVHQVRSMRFHATFTDGAAHELAVEFRAPGGFVYQRWTSSIAAGQTEVDFHLPVAGSSIDLDGMKGTWEALVWVDGVATASHDVELQS